MRKAWQWKGWPVVLGLLLAAATGYGQVIQHTIDPNGDDSPSAVKDLELSFRLNTVDILAPSVLITGDGQLGFTNYIKSGTQEDQGYVLVFRPEAENAADRIVTAIPVGNRPGLMFFNPTQTKIWVINLGNFGIINNTTASISIIDVNTLAVANTIQTPEYQFGFGSNVVFSADGATAFLSSTYTDQILKIDTASYQIMQTLLLTSQNPYYYTSVGPAWLTLSHDETFLCATNTFNDTVSIVDAANLTERHQVLFREAGQSIHTPNFTFRNNVLLNEADNLGFIASVGTQMLFGVVDRVYEFNPVTGLKIKDEDDKDVYLATADDPSQIMLDPSGEFLVIQVTSYDQVDTTDVALTGFPEIRLLQMADAGALQGPAVQEPQIQHGPDQPVRLRAQRGRNVRRSVPVLQHLPGDLHHGFREPDRPRADRTAQEYVLPRIPQRRRCARNAGGGQGGAGHQPLRGRQFPDRNAARLQTSRLFRNSPASSACSSRRTTSPPWRC